MRPSLCRTRRQASKLPLGVLLLALGFWLTAFLMLHIGSGGEPLQLTPGQKAPVTIVSAVEFECEDINRTELARRQAEEAMPPVFSIRMEKLNEARRTLNKLSDRLQQLRSNPDPNLTEANITSSITDALDLLGVTVDPKAFVSLLPEGNERQLTDAMLTSLSLIWENGIISPAEKERAFEGLADSGSICIEAADSSTKTSKIKKLLLPELALQKVVTLTVKAIPKSISISKSTITELLRPFIVPNLAYNQTHTDVLRKAARENVPTIMMTVRAHTTLIESGSPLTDATYEMLQAHENRLRELQFPLDRVFEAIGMGSLLMIGLILCAGMLELIEPQILRSTPKILLTLILSLVALIPTKALLYLSNTTDWISPALIKYLLPLGLTPLLATILMNGRIGFVAGLWTSFAAALLWGNDFMVFSIGLIVTTVATHTASGAHQRSRVFRAGLWVGLAEVLCAITLAVLDQQAGSTALTQIGTGLANGLVCAILTLLLIPLFEALFKITTDIKLLELSDMGAPLLERLAMEAPGTYHHSLMVANLAQAAAQQINANPLLVRVCAYYHDIGKLTKPEFFIENTQLRDNPHDELEPSMSTLVVVSHVKEGITLAQRHKLPQVIIDGIAQHHGTGLVSYFYHRARKRASEAPKQANKLTEQINEQDYRYSGPKPNTPEMAILALADSIEAASRSMDKPNAKRIENLVNEITTNKLLDGQLEECSLTMAQIGTIKKAFVFALTNMLHVRVPYPQDEDTNTPDQSTADTSNAGRTNYRSASTSAGTNTSN